MFWWSCDILLYVYLSVLHNKNWICIWFVRNKSLLVRWKKEKNKKQLKTIIINWPQFNHIYVVNYLVDCHKYIEMKKETFIDAWTHGQRTPNLIYIICLCTGIGVFIWLGFQTANIFPCFYFSGDSENIFEYNVHIFFLSNHKSVLFFLFFFGFADILFSIVLFYLVVSFFFSFLIGKEENICRRYDNKNM